MDGVESKSYFEGLGPVAPL